MSNKAQVINVVSGKGGTGKSLLTAVLGRALSREGHKVLLIDLDIFVRGLTILLASSSHITKDSDGITTSELISRSQASSNEDYELLVDRFYECDVMPAVRQVGEPFAPQSAQHCSFEEAAAIIGDLLDRVRNQYDLIFLDSRAGVDSFILAACSASDVILSIAEDDEVSLQTNTNLINHLKYNYQMKDVYTIVNKERQIRSYNDLQKSSSSRKVDFNYVGVIPFDAEVMDDFGTERFWSSVYQTLYFRATIDAWNKLARQAQFNEVISEGKYSFPPRIFMSPNAGRFSLVDRMLIAYGTFSALGGLVWLFLQVNMSRSQLLSTMIIVIGIMMVVMGIFGFRQLVVSPRYSNKHPDH